MCSREHCTAVSWIRVCVWAGGVLRYFHLFVQLTSRGSSGGPRTVLGIGSRDEEVTQVHGPGDPEVEVWGAEDRVTGTRGEMVPSGL